LTDVIANDCLNDYWKQTGISVEYGLDTYADVPICLVGGWYDPYVAATLDLYQKLARRNSSLTHRIIGPWTHGGMDDYFSGDIYLGAAARLNYDLVRLQWFDETLKGIDRGISTSPPIKLFVMGG